MNSPIQKKYEKLIMNEKNDENDGNDANYNNLISQELFELCKINKYHREYSSQLIHLSFLLYLLSPTGFELLRKFLPFPSYSKIYEHINLHLPPIISSIKQFKISEIPHSTIILASKSKTSIPICLGIDAVCVVASNKYTNLPIENLYSFTIYLQPLLPQFKCIPVRLIECKSGIGNKDIVKLLIETSNELEHLKFSVHFLSFYGDHCYNEFNHSFFNSYEKHLQSGNLFIIIGDPLHMMKNLKSRFLKCIISLDKSGTISFSLTDLISTLGDDKQYLKDKTQLGAMRDGLALQLFDMNNILFLLQKGEFTIMMALLPKSLLQFSL
ncbi:hypothetical protein M9Y10_019341 [Tritrichomonas musculus]|uniref:DDE-1 domain-containing protein n=1 Tax=Tritrichomonas musculus TaxID=1915356 RepID=A0ABR2HKR3_9EUKA